MSEQPEPRRQSGARSGALIAGASFVATALNYAFLLAAARALGSDDYGDLAALFGLLTVVLLPSSAVQLAVSREVSRRFALGDAEGAHAFGRTTMRLGLLVTPPVLALALAFAIPVRNLLGVDSVVPVLIAAAGLAAALVMPIATGLLQGQERFHAIALLYVLPFALRLALLGVVVAIGYHLGGAVFAAIAGGIAAALVAVWLLRDSLRRGSRATAPALGPFLRYLWPVVVGLIGVAVLTNLDVVLVNARFSDEQGEYAAASAFARVAFFLPITILAVLFPRTAARQARGEEAGDILGRTLIVTAAFGGLLAVFYTMTARGLLYTSFGAEFADGGDLVPWLTLSMTLFALVNVLAGFHLSRAETRYAWIVAAAVPVQIVVLAEVPSSVYGVIYADLLIGVGLLAAHELLVGSSLGALRSGLSLLLADVTVSRRGLREAAAVLLGATGFVCVLFWPLVLHLGSTVVARGSDPIGGVWSLWRMQQEGGYHLFGTTHHTLTGAPFGWDEANGLNLQWLLPYYPAYLVTKVVGEVAAFNLVLLAGYVLSGASMYLLARYLGCNRLVAAWAGMVFVVFPWHLMRTPHPSLVHLELLPILLLALVAAAQRPTWPRFLLVGGATLGCWLTSGYYGTMAVIVAAAFGLGVGLTLERRRGAILLAAATGAAFAASVFVASLAVIAGTGQDVGVDRAPGELTAYGLRPLELVVPAADNLVLGGPLERFWDSRSHGSNPVETSNYVGLLTLALALGWIVLAWRRRATLSPRLRAATLGFAAITVVAFLLALPSPISVLGGDVWAPSRLLWEVTPAFRVPTRWMPVLMTALIPLAALGLQALVARAARASRSVVVPVAVVAVAMAVSFLELGVTPAEPRIRTTLPAEYEALARTPNGILAEYPLIQDVDRLFWQRDHHRRVVNSEAFGTRADEARRMVVDPAAPGTAETLALLGVTAILTTPEALDFNLDVPDVSQKSWGPGYELAARTPEASLWRVAAPAAPALVSLVGGFSGPYSVAPGRVAYPLVAPSGVGTIDFVARAPSVVRLEFDAEPPKGETRTLRVGDAAREQTFTIDGRTHVSTLVEVPRGRSYIFVKTDPPPESEDDAIVLFTPRAVTSAKDPVLRAVSTSSDPGF